jgi:hypothetical protein
MRPVVTVGQTLNKAALMRHAMRLLEGQEVLVGIPEDKAARGDDEKVMTNAVLGYIHEHGSPRRNIPARPFLKPGIAAIVPTAAKLLRAAAKDALRGNAGAVTTTLNKIGLLAVNSVRGQFADNDWEALKPATLAARARKEGYRGPRRKKGEVATPKRNKPLIWSGQLRKAITYVVRKK